MTDRSGGAARALIRALDMQRGRLLGGDIRSLETASEDLERLASDLSEERVPDDLLRQLRAAAERNANLLQAGARGIRSVRRRIQELTEDRSADTYSADGARVAMSTTPFGNPHR